VCGRDSGVRAQIGSADQEIRLSFSLLDLSYRALDLSIVLAFSPQSLCQNLAEKGTTWRRNRKKSRRRRRRKGDTSVRD